MKNIIKNSSRKILVITLSVIMVLANVVTAAADTTVTHQTVYSPMDLFDGSTLMASDPSVTPTFQGGAYNSSVWKFAAANDSFFIAKTAEIADVSVKTVLGGVQLSWGNINDNYTVKVSNGKNNKEYFTTCNTMLLENLTAGANYRVQVVADSGKVSEVVSFANDKAAVQMVNSVMPLETGNSSMLALFDDNAKGFLNANGALVLKMKTTINTEANVDITVNRTGEDSLTVGSNDCYVSTNTFIYPTAKDGEKYSLTRSEFWSDSGSKKIVFLNDDASFLASADQNYNGIHERYYRTNAIGFTDGYVIIPLDDYAVTVDGETVKYNLIDTTKASGVLTIGNTLKNYCYYDGSKIFNDSTTTRLIDREIECTEMYIVSDFASEDYENIDYSVYTADNSTAQQESAYDIMTDTDYVKGSRHASLNSHMMLSSANASSFYNFYCNTNNYTKNTLEYTQRGIEYVIGAESMAFGFTARADGTYEIAAPLSVTGNSVKYSVYKTDANGNKTFLQAEQAYASQDTFCCLQVKLTAGDTVWLSATGDEGAVINIGIPEARLITSEAYTYMLTDYMENADVNGLAYATGSATANTKGAWDFGYFNFIADIGTMLKNFTNISILSLKTAQTDAAVDDALISAKTPYELIRQGKYYNAVDVNAESIATAASGAGVMSASGNAVTLGFHQLSAATTGASLYGHYFEFTSPISGKSSLSLGGKVALDKGIYMMITVNDVVKVFTYETTAEDYTFDVDVTKGDKICVYMYSFKVAKKSFSITPSVTVSAENGYSSVSYNTMGGNAQAVDNDFALNGSEITLPTATKTGARFNGWVVNGADTVTAADETITITTDTTLVADYDIYGDLNDDNVIDNSDMDVLRKHIIGAAISDRADLAKLNSGNDIDICDMVIISKIISGKNVEIQK